jgi:hypothetical protein
MFRTDLMYVEAGRLLHKLARKRCGQTRIGKTPANNCTVGIVFAVAALWFNVVLI